jgi:lysozyme
MLDQQTQERLKQLLLIEEGYRSTPYKDQNGNLTVGIGWNLYALPITQEQALYLCGQHIQYFDAELFKHISCYESLDPVRKAVLVDMAFQMGIPHLLEFKQMLTALNHHDYTIASSAMLDSDWARTFTTRARTLSNMMLSGTWPG